MSQQRLPKPPIHDETLSYSWRAWLNRLYVRANDAGQIAGTQVDLTLSNLVDLGTRLHNDLQNFQGGTTAEYYHLTSSHHMTLTGGLDADALHNHPQAGFDASELLLTPADALITDGLGNALIGEM